MVSHHRVVRDATEFAVQRLVGLLAAVLPLIALIQVLANARDYRHPAVAVAVWLAMIPVAVWLVPRIRADGLGRRETVAAIAIATAAVAVIGWEHSAHFASGRADLAVLGTVWLLALAALSSPARVWIPGALLVFAVHSALIVRSAGTSPVSLSQLEASGYVLATALVAFAALQPAMATAASISAQRAALASRSVAERAATAAVQEDRGNRLALLEMHVLPLLRAVADGEVDPTSDKVRELCALHAAALRHSLTDRTPGACGPMAWLGPALNAARARGMPADLRVIGDPGATAPDVAQAVLSTVDAVIGALPPHQVLLTVLAPGDDVELYVTFGRPLPNDLDLTRFWREVPAAARWHASLTAEQTGTGCLQLTWRKAVPLDRPH